MLKCNGADQLLFAWSQVTACCVYFSFTWSRIPTTSMHEINKRATWYQSAVAMLSAYVQSSCSPSCWTCCMRAGHLLCSSRVTRSRVVTMFAQCTNEVEIYICLWHDDEVIDDRKHHRLTKKERKLSCPEKYLKSRQRKKRCSLKIFSSIAGEKFGGHCCHEVKAKQKNSRPDNILLMCPVFLLYQIWSSNSRNGGEAGWSRNRVGWLGEIRDHTF